MRIGKFQEGGVAPAQQDPMAVLLQGAQQAVQNQDCQIASQVCQMVLEMLGGGSAPAEGAGPEAAAPEQGEPVYRAGGRLIRRINK